MKLLVNNYARPTVHTCVRLERRPHRGGIVPIYRCTVTGQERAYGCLNESIDDRDLQVLYPDVPLVTIRAHA